MREPGVLTFWNGNLFHFLQTGKCFVERFCGCGMEYVFQDVLCWVRKSCVFKWFDGTFFKQLSTWQLSSWQAGAGGWLRLLNLEEMTPNDFVFSWELQEKIRVNSSTWENYLHGSGGGENVWQAEARQQESTVMIEAWRSSLQGVPEAWGQLERVVTVSEELNPPSSQCVHHQEYFWDSRMWDLFLSFYN